MQVLLDVLGMQSDLTSYLGPPLMHSILGADFGGSGVFAYIDLEIQSVLNKVSLLVYIV